MLLFACFDLCVSVLGLCICVFLFVEQRYSITLKVSSEYNMVGDDGDNGAARPNGKRCRHLFPLIATPPDMRRIHGVSQSNNGKTQVFLQKCQQLIKVQFSSDNLCEE